MSHTEGGWLAPTPPSTNRSNDGSGRFIVAQPKGLSLRLLASVVLTVSGGRTEGLVHLRSSCHRTGTGCVVGTIADQRGRVCLGHWCPSGTDVSNHDEPCWAGITGLAADW